MRTFLPALFAIAAWAQPSAGPNVNMVAGTQWPNGDPYLQRQNEPSLAVSTRNPLHLLGGSNDYRSVDLSITTDKLTGDSWLGLYKSLDGGQTWKSSLLPGCPYSSPVCTPNVVFPAGSQSLLTRNFGVAYGGADPVVRAGTNGLFYYAGIAFERRERPISHFFVARYIDDNNVEQVDADPIRYLSTSIVDTDLGNQFIDKPWIAVDRPRAGALNCTIPAGPGGVPAAQTFQGGNVYAAWARFTGTVQARIMFSRSTDCGVTWSFPVQLSDAASVSNQGVTIAVAPASGEVYVSWRRFASATETDAIMVTKSVTGGRTFGTVDKVADIIPFDLPKSPAGIRTLTFPSMTVDANGRVYIVWAARQVALGDSRVMLSSSAGGAGWSAPSFVDPVPNIFDGTYFSPVLINPGRGHQLMPSIQFTNGRLAVAYYDMREDSTSGVQQCPPGSTCASLAGFQEYRKAVGTLAPAPPSAAQLNSVFTASLVDVAPAGSPALTLRHTLDVRVAMAAAGAVPAFTSTRVSQYPYGSPSTSPGVPKSIQQLRHNVPNLPMFQQGTTPFLGDYLDINAQPFVPGTAPGSWVSNTATNQRAVFYTTWTDNRDVRPPADGNWARYTPLRTPVTGPAGPACEPGQSGSRNQNVYMARVSDGLTVTAPGNAKQLSPTLQRSFSVVVQNNTDQPRSYRLSVGTQPPGGLASFLQTGPLANLDVAVLPRASVSRTLYATSSNPKASIPVNITEIVAPGGIVVPQGQTSSVRMNPDLTNPDLTNPDLTNPSIQSAELYTPDLTNPDLTNPDLTNPDLTNPDLTNPDLTNPDLTNPDLTNLGTATPDLTNPDLTNPDLTNPDLTNTNIQTAALTDAIWRVTNKGNTTATYRVKLVTPGGVLPSGFKAQMIVYKTFAVPGQSTATCNVVERAQNQIIANIPNPQFFSKDDAALTQPADALATQANAATITLAPGETGRVALRVHAPSKTAAVDFLERQVQPVTIAQARNTGSAAPFVALAITSLTVPDTVAGRAYNETLTAVGGVGPYTWDLVSGVLPNGLALSPSGVIFGTPSVSASFTFTVRVRDSGTPQQDDIQILQPTIVGPLQIVTTTLRDGVRGQSYTNFAPDLTFTGGLLPITWAVISGSLPPGLSLSATSGHFVGTPTVSGSYTFTIRARDALPVFQETTRAFTLRVFEPLVAQSGRIHDMISGQPYSYSLAPTGGLGPMSFVPIGGSLPSGITMSAGGVLTGTPFFVTSFSFSYRVTDSASPPQTTTATVTGMVVQAVGISSIPSGRVNEPISGAAQPTNSLAPHSFSLIGGTLPPGVSMNSAGVFSGTPTVPGEYPITLRITDSGFPNQTANVPLTMSISPFYNAAALTPGRAQSSIVKLADGRALLMGGAELFNVVASARIYDPTTNTWSATIPMQSARGSATHTLLGNGKVLVAGGSTGSGRTDTTELYDPLANSFSPGPTMPGVRAQHQATLLNDGRVLITGGHGALSPYNSTLFYNPATNTFAAGPTMNEDRHSHTAIRLPSGDVLVIGGFGSMGFAGAEIYSVATNTFTAVPGTPISNISSAALLNDGRVLVWSDSEAQTYTPSTGVFGSSMIPPAPLYGFGVTSHAVMSTGKVLFVNSDGTMLFNPTTNSFAIHYANIQAGSARAVVVLNSGKVLIAGGMDAFGQVLQDQTITILLPPFGAVPMSNVELYQPF